MYREWSACSGGSSEIAGAAVFAGDDAGGEGDAAATPNEGVADADADATGSVLVL